MPSLQDVENSGRPVIFKLRTIFGRKILFFYWNLNIYNVKIKRLTVKSKLDFNRITADCSCETDASIAPAGKVSRLRLQHRRVDTGFILDKKSGAIGGTFIAYCHLLRPADVRTDTFSISTIIYINF